MRKATVKTYEVLGVERPEPRTRRERKKLAAKPFPEQPTQRYRKRAFRGGRTPKRLRSGRMATLRKALGYTRRQMEEWMNATSPHRMLTGD